MSSELKLPIPSWRQTIVVPFLLWLLNTEMISDHAIVDDFLRFGYSNNKTLFTRALLESYVKHDPLVSVREVLADNPLRKET